MLAGNEGSERGLPRKEDLGREAGDFPGCRVVRNPPANAGETCSTPGPGRSHVPQSD